MSRLCVVPWTREQAMRVVTDLDSESPVRPLTIQRAAYMLEGYASLTLAELAALKAQPTDIDALMALADRYAGWQAAMDSNPTEGAMKCRRSAREALRTALAARKEEL